MKKAFFFSLILIGMICSFSLSSCGNDDYADNADDVSYGEKIKVSPWRIQIKKANRAGVKVKVTSPSKWNSTCDNGVKCSPTSGGKGETTVTINRTASARKGDALIFFKCDGSTATLGVELVD